jgi:hypothetical protein
MTQLLVHIVDELDICEPVASRWCYPMECYLTVLKNYVRNKVKPEGCMTLGYMYDEALGFCTKYFTLYPDAECRMLYPKEEECDAREVFHGVGKLKRLFAQKMEVIDEHVISNSTPTEALYRYFSYYHILFIVFCLVVLEWFAWWI